MFTLSDAITDKLYRDDDVKKFREQWNPQSGSRIWVIPGHVLYTSIDGHYLKSCDVCPSDITTKEKNLESNFVPKSGYVFDICVIRENSPTRILVIFSIGNVDIYQYCQSNYEWTKGGHFNLFTNDKVKLDWVYFHHRLNSIIWCERLEDAKNNINCSIYKRILPLEEGIEISDTTIEPVYPLLSNCPKLEITAIGESFCLVPKLSKQTSIYVICNQGFQFRLCDLYGEFPWKSLRYDALSDSPVDFLTLVTRNIKMWKYPDIKYRLCRSLSTLSEKICFLSNNTLAIFVNSSGDICNKRNLFKFTGDVKDCFLHKQLMFIFTEEKLYISCTETGTCLESLDLPYIGPPGGIWYYCSSISLLGVYTDHTIYQLHYKSIVEIVNSSNFSHEKAFKCLMSEQFQFLTLIQELIDDNSTDINIYLPSQLHHHIQSKALLLAALHWHRNKISNRLKYQMPDIQSLMCSRESHWPGKETKLRKLLKQQVDCFCSIEREKWKFFHNYANK